MSDEEEDTSRGRSRPDPGGPESRSKVERSRKGTLEDWKKFGEEEGQVREGYFPKIGKTKRTPPSVLKVPKGSDEKTRLGAAGPSTPTQKQRSYEEELADMRARVWQMTPEKRRKYLTVTTETTEDSSLEEMERVNKERKMKTVLMDEMLEEERAAKAEMVRRGGFDPKERRKAYEKELAEQSSRRSSPKSSKMETTDSELEVKEARKRKERSPRLGGDKKTRSVSVESVAVTERESEIEDTGTEGKNEMRGVKDENRYEEMRDLVELVRDHMRGMVKTLKIGKIHAEKQEKILKRLNNVIIAAEMEMAEMRGRIKERHIIVEDIGRVIEEKISQGAEKINIEGQQMTYAAVARETGTGGERRRESRKIASVRKDEVIIRKEGLNSEEIRKELVKEKLEEIGVLVRKMVKTRRGLVVEVDNREEVQKIIQSEKLKEKGCEIMETAKKRQMVLIYDLEKGSSEELTLKEIWRRNFEARGCKEEDFAKYVRVRRKVVQRPVRGKANEEKENWIVEVEGKLFREMIKKKSLYIGWEMCRVRQYINIVRCFQCQGYGHTSRTCNEAQICGFCAGKHRWNECRAREDEVCCVNCHCEGRRDDHEVTSKECFVYKRVERRYLDTLEYGDWMKRRDED